MNRRNPFEYNMNEQKEFESFYTQRKASYKQPAKETYEATEKESYIENIEAPTPQIMKIDGYKSEKEL